MIPVITLRTAVRKALQQLSRMKDVAEAEVFASSTEQLLCRLNYTSEIPCNGLEEPKSMESFGIGIRAVFTGVDRSGGRDVPHIGFGSEARDFSRKGIRRAIEKARQNAVPDPEFVCLPGRDSVGGASNVRRLTGYHDPTIMRLNDTRLVEAGWKIINEALETFSTAALAARLQSPPVAGPATRRGKAAESPLAMDGLASQGLVVGGDLNVVRQRIAVASSKKPKGLAKIQTDESTYVTSSITAMVESQRAKGTGYAAATHLTKLKGEAGSEAARNAIQASGAQRLATGAYSVVLGPQPVSDLVVNLLLPSLTADAFYSCRSTFLGEMGHPIAAELLTVYDHGAIRGGVGSKGITCEGLPTGRTDLIRAGILTGILSNHYEAQRLMRDPNARDKLGIHPQDHPEALVPRNGFRLSNRGARQFDALPSIAATNVFIEGTVPHTTESLLELVCDGVYIGRIWYTYPMNGLRAGDFTCTVVADSYLIRHGRIAAPLQSNTIRISGNIRHLLHNIRGITKATRPVLTWGSDEVVYAPEMAVDSLHLSEIAQFMQSV
jgi:PmbA protein